jgi:carbamoyltransferase
VVAGATGFGAGGIGRGHSFYFELDPGAFPLPVPLKPLRNILGISAFYHDSAAALVRNGEIIAAAQEERFTRRKNDESFPRNAIASCLEYAGLKVDELDAVVFYEKPVLKFSRTLEVFITFAPRGWQSFLRVVPAWLGERLNLRKTLADELQLPKGSNILFSGHHQAHAASAFFPSPFEESAVLTIDGVGEYTTTAIGLGAGHELNLLKELQFPHSVGLLYSAFTAYCGFRVNSGEYKLMGLAPYGEPRYETLIREKVIELKPDGSFWLNMEYFSLLDTQRITNQRFNDLFGGPPREAEGPFTQRHLDIARSIQNVTEEIVLRLARQARALTGKRNLCLAGGVALNCVANGRILGEKIFDQIWIQPAAGDAGGALGAALAAWHEAQKEDSTKSSLKPPRDQMRGALLGPEFSDKQIEHVLTGYQARYTKYSDSDMIQRAAELLASGRALGWVQGRMEFGPRALGNRSILADPRLPEMQRTLNLKVKKRESFRPFAPAILRERVEEFFELSSDSPYMLLVAPVRNGLRLVPHNEGEGLDRLKTLRSTIPAVTHVDYSARVQTVEAKDNPRFHALLSAFAALTGCPLLLNTSFNIRGEPIVCTPEDAYRCFLQTELDYLAIGNFLLERAKQPTHDFKPTAGLD